MAPDMHAIISAIDKPYVPSHIPPTPINLMSPMPIAGVSDDFDFGKCSNAMPINVAIVYPNVAPKVACVKVIGVLKKEISIKPINDNGNRYLSGMIRLAKSLRLMRMDKYAAIMINKIKNM